MIRSTLWFWNFKKLFYEDQILIKLIYFWSDNNNLYPRPLGVSRHDYHSNMDAELPVFHICHPKPCWRKTHPILGCILCKHGFTCKIRNNGNSAPIFRGQSGVLLCNRASYHLLVCEHKKSMTSRFPGLWNNAKIWH